MPYLTRGDAEIHYLDTHDPKPGAAAPTIVFGHGLLFSGWLFHPQIAALRDDFRCLAIDWRGQGRSSAPAGDYDMDVLTQDAVALIEQLEVGPVHYVGLSMGGFVGMRLAARRPDLVRTLTLLDTSAQPEPEENVGKYKMLATVYRLFGMGPVRKQVEPIMFAQSTLDDPGRRAVVDEWLGHLKQVPRGGMKKAILGVVNRKGVEDELAKIQAPTLVAVGESDVATVPAKSEHIAERIAGSRLEIIPDAGHSSTIEQPEHVTRLISEHVAAHP